MGKNSIFVKIIIVLNVFFIFLLSTPPLFASVEVFFDPNLGYKNNFGYSVDMDGNTAVVGAPDIEVSGGPEAAYIYTYDGLGWNLDTTLPSPNSAVEEKFGMAVAVDGDVVAVGAYGYGSNRGAVYVYEYSGGQWTGPNTLTASGGSAGEYFGRSVDVQGNTIVAGASYADDEQGAAYVFEKSGSTWNQVQKMTASDGQDKNVGSAWGDRFGYSVSIDGNTIVVGAYYDDIGSERKPGSAYVFEKSGGSWPSTEDQKLTASDGVGGDLFGRSVSVDGGTIAVGASYADSVGHTSAGKVYIYDWNDTDSNWVGADSPLEDPTPTSSGYFGRSVSLDGNNLLVGASGDDVGGVGTGNVYLCVRDGNSWSMEAYSPSDLADSDRFGFAVSLDADYMVVGAYQKDHSDPSVTNCGAVYFIEILAADLNRDGWVNFEDFAILAGQWLQVPSSPSADIAPVVGGDGFVDIQDLRFFCSQW